MLYQIREAQRAVLKPLASWADSMSHLYGDPYSPLALTPFANRISAGFELMHRLGKDYEKPEFGLSTTHVDGYEVPVSERIEMALPRFHGLLDPFGEPGDVYLGLNITVEHPANDFRQRIDGHKPQ